MKKLLMLGFAALALVQASPASAQEVAESEYRLPPADIPLPEDPNQKYRAQYKKWRTIYIGARVMDLALTKICLEKAGCYEANPLYGKHPSDLRLFGLGGLLSAVLVGIEDRVAKRDPKAARDGMKIATLIQLAVDANNVRVVLTVR